MYLSKFRCRKRPHSRSTAGSLKKNRQTKLRQRRNRAKLKSMVAHAEKDIVIEKLEQNLKCARRSVAARNMCTLSNAPVRIFTTPFKSPRTIKATSVRLGSSIESSRDSIIAKCDGIPRFSNSGVLIKNEIIAKGGFGEIRKGRIAKLGVTVAAKVVSLERCTKKTILAEAIVGMTLSGHPNFPYCFGLLNDNTILMELFIINDTSDGVALTLAKKLRSGIMARQLKNICHTVLLAITYMHSKHILHNDIKADNVVIASTVKIIDFGKATMAFNPVKYNILPGTAVNKKYNTNHRHLAHELRNTPGSVQSYATDTYSIGHMFKHAGASANYLPLVELGRLMKRIAPSDRLSLKDATEKIPLL